MRTGSKEHGPQQACNRMRSKGGKLGGLLAGQGARHGVDAGGAGLIQVVQALRVAAEQLHVGDHGVGVVLFLQLLVDEPAEELLGAVVVGLERRGVDVVDERCASRAS